MKNLVIIVIILAVTSSASAETQWEAYLAVPTPENAVHVKKIEYTPGAIPEKYGYWAPDLEILRDQVLGGDQESFRLAYRLRKVSDGGLLEELTIILSHVIRARPEFFLNEMSALNPSKAALDDILLMPGLEYTDRDKARQYEIKMRHKALASVQNQNLRKFRDMCLGIIGQGNM